VDTLVPKAIASVQKAELAYCKFITANDTGETGGHQAGFHIHQNAWELAFNSQGEKGSNKDSFVTIRWQDDFETDSRFIYYGTGTRNEYRLTRFGKGFPFLSEHNVGNLLVLARQATGFFDGFVLETENDIESFFAAFGISASQANRIIDKSIGIPPQDALHACFIAFIKSVKVEFPTTLELSRQARDCYHSSFGITPKVILKYPDRELLQWLETEYQLFKAFENDRYKERIKTLFKNVEELIGFANQILNRRKSRAGKSLEHHLDEVFKIFDIPHSIQGTTEESKRPDFLFPNEEAYHNKNFDSGKLVFMAAKTTCKDRWRQILSEADRIPVKHLFTLQQGISKNQLSEMYNAGVRLVVPKAYLTSFPEQFRENILTLETFIPFLKGKSAG
jgi:hypothetical protein